MTSSKEVAAEVRAGIWAVGAAFLFVLAVGVLVGLGSPIRHDVLAWSVGLIRPAISDPSIASLTGAAAGAVGYASVILFQPLSVIFAFMLVEIWMIGQPASWRNTVRSLFYRTVQMLFQAAIAYFAAQFIGKAFFQPLIHIAPYDGHPVAFLLTTAGITVVAMIIHDFATYWAHRFEHRVKPLWRFHSVHHSITDLDAANSYAHPMDQIVSIVCVAMLGSIVNFTYENFLIIAAVKTIHEIFVHSRAPIHLGPLRRWIADNRFHHFHHSIYYKHYNKNFAEYFTLWDKVFGTCYIPADREMVQTGILGTKQPRNLWEYLTGSLERNGEDLVDPQEIEARDAEAKAVQPV